MQRIAQTPAPSVGNGSPESDRSNGRYVHNELVIMQGGADARAYPDTCKGALEPLS